MQVRTREHSPKEANTGANNIFKKYKVLIINILLFIVASIYMMKFPFDTSVSAWTFIGYIHFMLHTFFYVYLGIVFLGVFYFTLIALGGLFVKLISGELQKYIASKIIFIGGGINFIKNAEVFESENMNQNIKYYNSKKLKNDFQSYLFWKNITNAFSIYSPFFYLPILLFLIAYISLILSIIISGKIIFIGLFFIAIIISMIIFGPYLSFLKNKKHIQIKTLSFSPKAYAWKDKNTLYFK